MTIKETAGKLLLALYSLQIKNPIVLQDMQLNIAVSDRYEGGRTPPYFLHEEEYPLPQILHQISTNDSLLYNALHYLLGKSLINFVNTDSFRANASEDYFGLHLTDLGIDVVEGVNQGDEQKKRFSSLFNITVNNNVDSLIKAEVGNVVGIGGAISGKVTTK